MNYSVLKLVAGFAIAARIARPLIVITAINIAIVVYLIARLRYQSRAEKEQA